MFGKASGFAADLALSSLDGSNGFQISGETAWDYSGRSVASAEDVNGDGFADLLIAARGAERGGEGSGASYVVFGKASGFAADLALSSLDGSNGFRVIGKEAFDQSGYSVSSAGDVNGDGFADVLIGALFAGLRGECYVVFGKASGFTADLALSSLDGSNGFQISGEPGGLIGVSVSPAGDVNGDGFADLLIGDPLADPHGDRSGASYVVFGKASGFAANLALSSLNGSNGFQINGEARLDQSGTSVSAAGDVNGDGFADLLIGADEADPNGTYSGASYVVFGKVSGFSANLELSSLNGSNGFQITGEEARDYSGGSVSSAGDVNGDGFADLLIGAFGADPNGYASGASYVVFGHATTGAYDDNFSIAENGSVAGNVFADNGHGVDTDPLGGTLAVAAVNGLAANVGLQFALASGALVKVDADGAVTYSTNDAFDHLPAPGSGAANSTSATESFTYTLAGGTTATVTVTITGIDSDDVISGTAGANSLDGGIGNDQISGLGGNDILDGGPGEDVLDGGLGSDTASYASATAGVRIDLSLLTPQDTLGAGIDSLTGIENITGSAFADRLTGDGSTNVLSGGSQNDVYNGVGIGDVVIELLNQGYDTVNTALANYKLPTNVERVNFTGIGSFVGTGNAGDNRFASGAGDDRFVDVLGGADIFSGGVGRDSIDFRTSASGVGLDFITSVHSGAAAGDTYVGMEKYLGSASAGDTMTAGAERAVFAGYGGGDVLTGGAGRDQLLGGAGDDTLSGGAGRDTLDGGTGNDTMTGGSQGDVFVFLDAAFGQDTITDYQDGLDHLKVFSAVADDVTDFIITNNGTASVLLTLIADPSNTITINGAAALTISNADFVFY